MKEKGEGKTRGKEIFAGRLTLEPGQS